MPATPENILLGRLRREVRRMRTDELVKVVARLREGGHLASVEDCQTALAALSDRRSMHAWEEAIRVLESMRQSGLTPNSRHCSAAINACRRGGQWEQALALHRSFERNEYSYRGLIAACDEGGQWPLAVELLGEMRRDEFAPDLKAYTAAIRACERASQWLPALELLGTAYDDELTPDAVAFTSAVRACEKGKQMDLVMELLVDMWNQDIHPTVFTYNAAIRACGPARNWRKAMELMWLIDEEELKPDAYTYNAMIRTLELCGRWQLALTAFTDMKSENFRPTSETYLSLIGACDRRSHWGFALKLLHTGHRAVGLRGLTALEEADLNGEEPPRAAYLAALFESRELSRWELGLSALQRIFKDDVPMGSLGFEMAADLERTCVSPAGVKKLRQVIRDIIVRDNERKKLQRSQSR